MTKDVLTMWCCALWNVFCTIYIDLWNDTPSSIFIYFQHGSRCGLTRPIRYLHDIFVCRYVWHVFVHAVAMPSHRGGPLSKHQVLAAGRGQSKLGEPCWRYRFNNMYFLRHVLMHVAHALLHQRHFFYFFFSQSLYVHQTLLFDLTYSEAGQKFAFSKKKCLWKSLFAR